MTAEGGIGWPRRGPSGRRAWLTRCRPAAAPYPPALSRPAPPRSGWQLRCLQTAPPSPPPPPPVEALERAVALEESADDAGGPGLAVRRRIQRHQPRRCVGAAVHERESVLPPSPPSPTDGGNGPAPAAAAEPQCSGRGVAFAIRGGHLVPTAASRGVPVRCSVPSRHDCKAARAKCTAMCLQQQQQQQCGNLCR